MIRAHDALIESRVDQMHHANANQRCDDDRLELGKLAYLSTENLSLPKARARKLMPKYIGPYEIISCNKENSHYTLTLPDELLKRRIHPTFYTPRFTPHVLHPTFYTPRFMLSYLGQLSQMTMHTSPTGKLRSFMTSVMILNVNGQWTL